MDVSFRIFSVQASIESLIRCLSRLNKVSLPKVPVDEMIGKTWLGGPAGKDRWVVSVSVSVRWSVRGNPFPPLPGLYVPLFLYTKTICFSCSNEEQCLTDKGASSLLLCCLWLELDAGKNGNSQCECFFSSRTGYGWACTLYIADGTIVNTVRTRKEWITAFFPLASQETRNFLTLIFMSVCVWWFLSSVHCWIPIDAFRF